MRCRSTASMVKCEDRDPGIREEDKKHMPTRVSGLPRSANEELIPTIETGINSGTTRET